MGSSKAQQQEMVERSESSSPFWRSRPSLQGRQSTDSQKVIGASFSHADMVKLESLTTPSHSPTRGSDSPVPLTKSKSSTPRRNYHRFLSTDANRGWTSRDNDLDDSRDSLDFDNDEDEFGLPSLVGLNKKSRSKKNGSSLNSSSQGGNSTTAVNTPASGLWRTASGDIAEERGLPQYPAAKQSGGKILRPQYKDILRDPANSLHLINHPTLPANASSKEVEAHSARLTRINKFKRILQASSISVADLREAAWSGVPEEVRSMTWQVLLGYLPTSSERRVATLERKRKEYLDGVRQAFDKGTMGAEKPVEAGLAGAASSMKGRGRGLDEAIWHQISIDVPRTNPHLELYTYEATQRSLERILYVWAIRHPASGYVQGINDLVTPFWQVFLASYITDSNIEIGMDPGQLPKAVLDAVEADSFWCLTKLLDGIQDNYVHAQPGIQRQVASLRDLTRRIDETLVNHFESEGVEFMQFSFRWMNCLLMREISVKNTIRMWDTYLSQEQGFSEFHLYVCAAFLVKWSEQLLKLDFGEIMMFLQALPTREWSAKDIELLLSEAYIFHSLFHNSSAHLKNMPVRTASWGLGNG